MSDGGPSAGVDGSVRGARGLAARMAPTAGGMTVLACAVLVAAVALVAVGGFGVGGRAATWLFGIGLALLPVAGVFWVVGWLVPKVVGWRRAARVRPTAMALREGALWSFWLGWLLLVLFQPVVRASVGGLGSPVVRVLVVLVVAVGVVGRGLRVDAAERPTGDSRPSHGTLGTVLFVGSAALLGALTVATVFVLILAVGQSYDSMGPALQGPAWS